MMTTAESTTPRYNYGSGIRPVTQPRLSGAPISTNEHQKCTHVIIGGFGFIDSLDSVSDKAEDGTDPQQHGETAKQLSMRENSVQAPGPV